MTDPLKELYEHAHKAGENAYAPYSGYHVGAALRTVTNKIFSGCNAEIATYKGLCAEAGAIAAMISSGERHIENIVVVGPNNDLCAPCGDCRQRIREFSNASTRIHAFANDGTHLKTYTMDDLLPDSFGPENLPSFKPKG